MFKGQELVISPDPRLRQPCADVEQIDDDIRELAQYMIEVMYESDGVGLAAPQIGVLKRMVVIDCTYPDTNKKEPLVLINPEVTSASEEMYSGPEGCLSIPGVCFMIDRHAQVEVQALDLSGKMRTYRAEKDLFCRCLQHEIDHTNGITMFERMPASQRMAALREYKDVLDHELSYLK